MHSRELLTEYIMKTTESRGIYSNNLNNLAFHRTRRSQCAEISQPVR